MNCRGKIRVDTANVKTLRHDATEYLDSAICIYLCDSMWPISGAHQFREESWTDDRDLVTDLIRMGNTRFVFLGVRSIYADLFVVADGLPIRLKGNIEEHVTPKNQLTGSGVKSRIVRAAVLYVLRIAQAAAARKLSQGCSTEIVSAMRCVHNILPNTW